MKIELLNGRYAVCRLPPETEVPVWVTGSFASVTRTESELSIVASEEQVPDSSSAERGWRLLAVVGPIDFAEVGILAAVAAPLAAARVSLFTISTFDTDYLLVKETSIGTAIDALRGAGHEVEAREEAQR